MLLKLALYDIDIHMHAKKDGANRMFWHGLNASLIKYKCIIHRCSPLKRERMNL